MDLRKLKTLIDLVQQSGIAELEITEGEEKVRISRDRHIETCTFRRRRFRSTMEGVALAAPKSISRYSRSWDFRVRELR